MKTSTVKTVLRKVWPAAFWLLAWLGAAKAMNQPILLPTPFEALGRFFALAGTPPFRQSLAFTGGRILLGFLLSAALGFLCASLAWKRGWLRDLLSPLTQTVRAVPVASFTVLVLFWTGSRNLSVVITALIAFPVIYASALTALDGLDPRLEEMAAVFRVPAPRRFFRVRLPQLLPQLRSSLCVAMGLCWKSGVAAEIIGIPRGSVGEGMYNAKIYLDSADLFAWTLAVVLLSILCEGAIRLIVKGIGRGCAACRRR